MCHLFLKVFEVAPSFYMVELRKASGDSLEYHEVSQKHSQSFGFLFLSYLLLFILEVTLYIFDRMSKTRYRLKRCSFAGVFRQDWRILCGRAITKVTIAEAIRCLSFSSELEDIVWKSDNRSDNS
jgi:hypothetical protein